MGKRNIETPSPLGVFAPTGFWLHPNIPGGPFPLARPLEGWQEVITVDAQRTWGAIPRGSLLSPRRCLRHSCALWRSELLLKRTSRAQTFALRASVCILLSFPPARPAARSSLRVPFPAPASGSGLRGLWQARGTAELGIKNAPSRSPRAPPWPLGAPWPRALGTDGRGRAVPPPQPPAPGRSRNRAGGRAALRRGVGGSRVGGGCAGPRSPQTRGARLARVRRGRGRGGERGPQAAGRGGGARFRAGGPGRRPLRVRSRGAAIRCGVGTRWEAPAPDSASGRSGGRGAATRAFSRGRCSGRRRGCGGVGWEGALLAAHTSPIIKHYVQKAPGDFPEPRSSRRPPARPTEPMDLSAAAALCLWLLSACRPRHGLEAAAVLRVAGAGPAESPGGGGGGGRTLGAAAGASAAPAAAAPGARASRRAAGSGFRNGSVVPHQFMMSLYRSLAGRAPAGAAAASSAGSGRHGRADTITGFADRATPGTRASAPPVHPVPSRLAGDRRRRRAPAPFHPGRGLAQPQVVETSPRPTLPTCGAGIVARDAAAAGPAAEGWVHPSGLPWPGGRRPPRGGRQAG